MNKLLSVIIITKNEEHNIEDCLKSVAWADEIIIVDSGSTDRTVSICQQYTNQILVTDWPGYGAQKQRALSMATGTWVLSIDADERVTLPLKEEILATINNSDISNSNYSAYKISFMTEYCGKVIKFGDLRNDSQEVLFKRANGKFVDLLVHERIEINGAIGKLKGKIYHIAFPNLSVLLKKINDYSSLSATQKYQQYQKNNSNHKITLFTAISHGLWAFIRGYFLRFGFLDGKEGFLLAFSSLEVAYYKYLKLTYLQLALKPLKNQF